MSEEFETEIGIIGGTGVYDPGMMINQKKSRYIHPLAELQTL